MTNCLPVSKWSSPDSVSAFTRAAFWLVAATANWVASQLRSVGRRELAVTRCVWRDVLCQVVEAEEPRVSSTWGNRTPPGDRSQTNGPQVQEIAGTSARSWPRTLAQISPRHALLLTCLLLALTSITDLGQADHRVKHSTPTRAVLQPRLLTIIAPPCSLPGSQLALAVRSIVVSVSVRLSVCSHISETTCHSKSTIFRACWSCSVLLWRHGDVYFRFCG